jgi:hypothetical protein
MADGSRRFHRPGAPNPFLAAISSATPTGRRWPIFTRGTTRPSAAGQNADEGRGAADRGQHRAAAGVVGQSGRRAAALLGPGHIAAGHLERSLLDRKVLVRRTDPSVAQDGHGRPFVSFGSEPGEYAITAQSDGSAEEVWPPTSRRSAGSRPQRRVAVD